MPNYPLSSSMMEPVRNEQVLVGATSTRISESKMASDRSLILVRNISANSLDIIWVNMGYGQAVVGQGIQLKQNDSFSDVQDAGYNSYKGVYTAICETANGKLSIVERSQ